MLRWCAYCQTFLGESAPFADFSVSHGICPVCLPKFKTQTIEIARAQTIAKLFADIWTAAREGTSPDELQVLHDAKALGIRSVDFFIGMIQPMLYEIGRLFETGHTTVAKEHAFSAFADRLLLIVERDLAPEANTSDQEPIDILLLNLDGNNHDLGMRVISLFFREEGLTVKTAQRRLDVPGMNKLIQSHKPDVVGMSLALPHHVNEMKTLIDKLRESAPNGFSPSFMVGGSMLLLHLDLVNDLERDGLLVYNGNLKDLAQSVSKLPKRSR